MPIQVLNLKKKHYITNTTQRICWQKNSTERKKKARLEKAIVYYNKWHKTASDSDLINDAEQSLAAINKQLEQFNK
jgi:hypothetical protein